MTAVEPSYGSDRTGLVWGFRFVPGEPAVPIDADAAMERTAGTGAAPGFVWLHFNLSNAASERWIRQHQQLPDTFRDNLHEGIGWTAWA